MRRIAATVLAIGLLGGVVACGDDDDGTAADDTDTTKLDMWVQWEGRELAALETIVEAYEADNPGIDVELTPAAASTDKVLAAIRAGNAPDVWATYEQSNIGKLCSTGALIDLEPLMEEADVELSLFPEPVRDSTTFDGTTCALPYLGDAFGLYYNKALLAAAGFSAPPKTLDELSDMAVELTERDANGAITQAGFVPLINYYENYVLRFPPMFGARYFDDAGKATLSRDPGWKAFFQWQKSLVDELGYDALKKFAASAGDVYTPNNPFQTGKIAMVLDGEWRTAYLADEAPELEYGTAPFPALNEELQGASLIAPGIAGIPRGSEHTDEAFDLVRHLTTETDVVVQFANELHNLPSLTSAQGSPDLELGPNMDPFLEAFGHPRSSYAAVIEQGSGYFDPITQFAERWESGQVRDLDAGLRQVDSEIDKLLAQG